jgi:uncharacterized protein YoxC
MGVADKLKDSIMAAASVGSELKSMADDLLKKTMKGEDVSGELGPLEDAISKVETAQQTLDTLKSSVESANATADGVVTAQKAASLIPSVGPTGPVVTAPAVIGNLLREEAQKLVDELKKLPETVKGIAASLKGDLEDTMEIITKKIPEAREKAKQKKIR